MKLIVPTLLLISGIAATRPVLAQDSVHYTLRYLTNSGSPQQLRALAFSADSALLAVSVAGRVDIIDPSLGRVTGALKGSPFSMGFSNNGERLYCISERQSKLLDTLTGAEIQTRYKLVPGHLGISIEKQSGKLLVAQIAADGPGAAIGELQPGDELIGLAEGRGGEVRSVLGRTVRDVAKLLSGPAGSYVQLKVLPRGQFGADNAKVHVARRQPFERVGNRIRFVGYLPAETGERLVWCVSDGRHQFRSAATGAVVAQLTTIDIENIGQYSISPDQTKFAVVSRTKTDRNKLAVEVFDIATQDRLAYIESPKKNYAALAFAADNNLVLVATWDSIEIADVARERFVGRLDLGWKPPRAKPKKDDGSGGEVGAVVLSASADEYATGGEDPTRSPRNLVSELAVSSKDVVATADKYGHVQLWDMSSGRLLKKLPENPPDEPSTIQFSPDGRWLTYYIKGVLHVVDVSDVAPPPGSNAVGPSEDREE